LEILDLENMESSFSKVEEVGLGEADGDLMQIRVLNLNCHQPKKGVRNMCLAAR
jgi:hypothetical protein